MIHLILMDERSKDIIERYQTDLLSQGLVENRITHESREGYGHLDSFFDLMIDLKLEGKHEVSAQEVFDSMKAQLNYCRSTIVSAEKAYNILRTKYNDLQDNYNDKLSQDIKRKNDSK